MDETFDVLLFDLGGVLVSWDGIEPLRECSRRALSREDVRLFYFESPWVRRFEAGRCSAEEFLPGVIEELELDVTPTELHALWASFLHGAFPGAHELLDGLAGRFRLACLSNNNPIHWPRVRDAFGFGARFERAYVSHELGVMKPGPEIFAQVIGDLGVLPERILFFDDNPECVDAAQQAGMESVMVKGVDEVKRALAARGIHVESTEGEA